MSWLKILAPPRFGEQRRHPRVQLSLPVRLRWQAPLRQLTEVTTTLDTSRGGLLVSVREPREAGARLWVVFPFDSGAEVTQAEIPARVARVKNTPAGGHLAALEFLKRPEERPPAVRHPERRARPRAALALPIRIRPAGSPWPEESMTEDVSESGARFATARLYVVGDALRVSLPFGRRTAEETPARVVRVSPSPDGIPEQQIAIAFLSGALI